MHFRFELAEGNDYHAIFNDRMYDCRMYMRNGRDEELFISGCQYKKKPFSRIFIHCYRKWFPFTFLIRNPFWDKSKYSFSAIPYPDPYFGQCIRHFETLGFKRFKAQISGKGYVDVEWDKLRPSL